MDVKKEYSQLTDVDIDAQKMLWDERGKGYYGEYLVFCELLKKLEGNCKLLMNLNIPTKKGSTTEIDLVLIHETGVYVFEIKHHKGTIYGKQSDTFWTQYFRTSSNQKFNNPIMQNNYHINALNGLLPEEHFESIVVFTNEDVVLKLSDLSGKYLVTTLSKLTIDVNCLFSKNEVKYNCEQINDIFEQLKKYSPIHESTVDDNGTAIPIYNYVDNIQKSIIAGNEEIKQKSSNLDIAIERVKKEEIKNKRITIAIISFCLIVSILFCIFAYCGMENIYAQRVSEYEKTYLRIDEIDDESIDMAKGIVKVTDVNLTKSSNFKDSVSFSCILKNVSNDYGILINETSTLVVMLENGMTYEYPIFGEGERYYSSSSKIGPNDSWYSHSYQINELLTKLKSTNEITYIKITNISIWEQGNIDTVVLAEDVHIELYNKK